MKAVIQRVDRASVTVDGNITGKIDKGFLILLGVGQGDTEAEADLLASKITKMRIFSDEAGKINRSLADVGGNILVVSQFTLYANCKKGNRPDFFASAPADVANRLYEYFLSVVKKDFPNVQCGIFGAHMDIDLINNGPFTIILDTKELK